MVLLLYLWENLKKWGSREEMQRGRYGRDGGGQRTNPGGHECDDLEYQQMGGLGRLDSGSGGSFHFYPEGGWGWIICACAFLAHVTTSGAQLSAGALHIVLANKFQDTTAHHWLGPLSWSVSSLFSPLVVNICRRRNNAARQLSLAGGILFPLSLLCTSFATELHQIFFSFGLIGGIGSCLVRESAGVVLGEYFRRRRHFVEQFVLAGTGVGVTLFSLLYLSLSRHIEWTQGFRIGAALSAVCALLPAFYRAAAVYHPNRAAIQQLKSQRQLNKTSRSPKSGSSLLLPLGGDIFQSLHLFCVPSLKPILWSASIASFGLYAPVFLMSDFGRKEGLSGGSLLLLQTHLGLGLSLGVILGAILTLKKFQCCRITARVLCCSTCFLTGMSMIAISSVQGYYGYSLSAWIYGIALGSYLYTLKILTMDLTRTKYWGRIWSCIQSLMAPGIFLGTGATASLGKPGFYACATCVLLGAGLIGFQLLDLSHCGSPPLSSVEDGSSPIPPPPLPVLPSKYGVSQLQMQMQQHQPPMGLSRESPSFFPLRKSISLQQPFYPCCSEDNNCNTSTANSIAYSTTRYSPHCPDCNPLAYPPMIRSFSLPQALPESKTTGTQTNPNSPVQERHAQPSHGYDYRGQIQGHVFGQHQGQNQNQIQGQGLQNQILNQAIFPGSFDRLSGSSPFSFQPQVYPEQMGFSRIPHKHTVMFASNPQLYPQSSFSSQTDNSISSRPPSAIPGFHPHHAHHGRHPQYMFKSQTQQGHTQQGQRQGHGQGHQTEQQQEQQQQKLRQTGRGSGGALNAIKNYESQQQQQIQQAPPVQKQVQIQAPPPRKPPAFTRHYFDSSKFLAHKKPQQQHVQFRNSETEAKSESRDDKRDQVKGPPTSQGQKATKPHLQKQKNITQSDVVKMEPPPSVYHFQVPSYLPQSSENQQKPNTKSPGQSSMGHRGQDPSSNYGYQQQQQQQQQPRVFSQFQPTPQPLPSVYPGQSSYQQRQSQGQGQFKNQIEGQQSHPAKVPVQTGRQFQGTAYYLSRGPSQNHNQGQDMGQSIGPYIYHQNQHPHPTSIANIQQDAQQLQQQQQGSTKAKIQQQLYQSKERPYYYYNAVSSRQQKISSFEFEIEEPKFNSLRRPASANSSVITPSTHSHSQHHGQGHHSLDESSQRFMPSSGPSVELGDCPYCDFPERMCGPLSLSVPLVQQNDPHLMCHYGQGPRQHPVLRRRNTWHYHKDFVQAVTTSA